MRTSTRTRSAALLLVLAMLLGVFGGCTRKGGAQEETASDTAAAQEDTPVFGASWQQVFGDKTLPAEGWLKPDEVGFYRTDENGTPTVIVMTVDEMRSRLSELGNLPRTHYFEDQLDERFGLLFSSFDMALELGSRSFALPTTLTARSASEAGSQIDATYPLYGTAFHYSVTKDLKDENGDQYHFMRVQITDYTQEQIERYHEAVEECRKRVSFWEGMEEFPLAVVFYTSVTQNELDQSVLFDEDDQFVGWNLLYNLICNDTAEASFSYPVGLYTLFNLAGIDCLYVDGTIAIDGSVEDTAWCIAKLGGSYYIFDPYVDSFLSADSGQFVLFGISDDAFPEVLRNPYKSYEGLLPDCPNSFQPEDPSHST